MSLATVFSRGQDGVEARQVTVEVHLANGLPSLSIVGLPELAVRESKDRVRGALLNSRFEFPARRIIINLAPADLPKEGGRFDLPIALGILCASGQIPSHGLSRLEFAGELALSGQLRPIQGSVPFAIATRDAHRELVIPGENADEAALVRDLRIYPAKHLLEVCGHLTGTAALPPRQGGSAAVAVAQAADLADVRGQQQAKRALEVAAAGGHNLLLIGPPGTGKTMLASRLPGILPAMTEREALETAAIASLSQRELRTDLWRQRPFRSPHHTASGVALVGGGSNPRPGEISLAHNGVIFLDELPEFDRRVLEVLREPLESGYISISRAARQAEFPARFQLVAAMNPCPCGYLGDPSGRCHCTAEQIARYRRRISGPLLDRIDIQIEVPAIRSADLSQAALQGETSAEVRQRVAKARGRQLERSGQPNSQLTPPEIERYCRLDSKTYSMLHRALERLGLSARAYHRVLKVARTIADLAERPNIELTHVSEALGYRKLERVAHPAN